MFEDLGIDPGYFRGAPLYRGRGCERCKNSGYSGRLAIIEAMTMTDEIRKLVIQRVGAQEIGKLAIEQGMKTLRTVALEKVARRPLHPRADPPGHRRRRPLMPAPAGIPIALP